MELGLGMHRKTSGEGAKKKQKQREEHEVRLNRILSKEAMAAKPPAPVIQPKGADGVTSKCRHWSSVCCRLYLMPAFDAIIKHEGKLGILAPDSLGVNSSSRRG